MSEFKNKRIMIIGKVTDYPNAKYMFNKAENFLKTQEPKLVYNPCKMFDDNESWQSCLDVTTGLIKNEGIDLIYALPNWMASEGALLERKTAIENNIKIIDYDYTHFNL
jgi:hypothetical protein